MDDIETFVKNLSGSAPVSVVKLFGQASTREYYRATLGSGKSFVVMHLPKGFSSPADEVTKIEAFAPKELPFINVQKYLKKIGVLVPEIHSFDEVKGLILLEDLGDNSLEKINEKTDENFFLFYYKKVISTLVDLQAKTLETPPTGTIIDKRHFDEGLLNWEFDHFLNYAIEDRLQIKVPAEERAAFERITRALAKKITCMPQGFAHRDFQSRNILLKNYDFYLIDFQDALMGPVLYDLVSLLRDSYVALNEKMRDKLINHYTDILPKTHPYFGRSKDVHSDFHHIALQRKLKDTGRFQYIKTVRGNDGFLKNVPQSLTYVHESLAKLIPENAELNWLKSWIEKYLK